MDDRYQRDRNGVRYRADGKGDAWAIAHRSLGTGHQMHDVDALFGCHAFGMNTGEKLFLEYEPDHYENRSKVIRNFAVVAMFDRKTSEVAAFSSENRLSRALYLWQCRTFATRQSVQPKFFIVVGNQMPPWKMIELDIWTGERTGDPTLVNAQNFAEVWDALGLSGLRLELRKWISKYSGEAA